MKNKYCKTYSNLPFKFGIDKDGNYGYIKDGADTVIPFSNMDLENPIWINPNSIADGSFSAQTISLDLNNYKAVMIKCKYAYSEDETGRTSMNFCEVGKSANMTCCRDNAPATTGHIVGRGVTVNSNSVVFASSWYTEIMGQYPNAYCIPIAIYGIK